MNKKKTANETEVVEFSNQVAIGDWKRCLFLYYNNNRRDLSKSWFFYLIVLHYISEIVIEIPFFSFRFEFIY